MAGKEDGETEEDDNSMIKIESDSPAQGSDKKSDAGMMPSLDGPSS